MSKSLFSEEPIRSKIKTITDIKGFVIMSIQRTIGKASKKAERRPLSQEALDDDSPTASPLKFSIHSLMNTNGMNTNGMNTNGGAELKEKSIGFLEKRAQLSDSV